MLTADQLDVLTDDIVRMYNDFADTIIADIARRLAGLDYARPTAAWQMQRLIEAGKLFEDILSEISKLTGRSEAELRRMFKRAGVTAMRFDDAIYKAAGLNPLPLNMSPAMAQALSAGLVKTSGVMRNLTMTTAMSGQQAFIDAADLAYMQISTGALDYNTAIRRAVKDVASKGLSVIHYSSRREQLDVAMRRAALTGVNQTVGTMQQMRADEMGTDLVQVSAHIGARPTHEVWQGKIYSRSGSSRKYPDFVSSTGYGTAGGLSGINCRHSWYPFFDGISENAYSRAELASYANKTVTYNGKKMSVYEATQEQRAIERKIRYWKRQVGAIEAAGFDASAETAKVKAWQAQARDLVRQTGLSRQYPREWVNIEPKATVVIPAQKTQPVTVPSAMSLEDELDKAERRIYSQENYETAIIFDQQGNTVLEKNGQKNTVEFEPDELAKMNGNVLTHNHPLGWGFPENDPRRIGNSFSEADFALAAQNGLSEIRAVTPVHTYSLKPGQAGWPDLYDYLSLRFKIIDDAREEIKDLVNSGKMTYDEAEAQINHMIFERIAKQFDLQYNRREHSY